MSLGNSTNIRVRKYTVAGLFAGIGGFELGFGRAGHETVLFSEIDLSARAVLENRFRGVPNHPDVTDLKSLPRSVDLVTAGFPCQDLSQAGQTSGIAGTQSSLVSHVFRLLRKRPVETVVLENVPFMLQLGRGQAMSYIFHELEELGYMWAYRVVDSRAFGLPQRRRRVYVVASQEVDPRRVVFTDDAHPVEDEFDDWRSVACGFYWTEGTRGLGWAHDAVPTLKGGSTVGIPSPPAIVLPSGMVVKPTIRAAERFQGFRADWTRPAERVGRASFRWKLVGNAVSVPAATWVGRRLAKPGAPLKRNERALPIQGSWPTAAYNVDGHRVAVDISEWPKLYARRASLAEYLEGENEPLSLKATSGFLSRAERSKLRFPDGFLDILRQHVENGQHDKRKRVYVSAKTKRLANGSQDVDSDGKNSSEQHGGGTASQKTVPRERTALPNC